MNITICPRCHKLLHINNLQLHSSRYGKYPASGTREAEEILKTVRLDCPEELTFAWCDYCLSREYLASWSSYNKEK